MALFYYDFIFSLLVLLLFIVFEFTRALVWVLWWVGLVSCFVCAGLDLRLVVYGSLIDWFGFDIGFGSGFLLGSLLLRCCGFGLVYGFAALST